MHADIHRRIVNAKYVLEKATSTQHESNEMNQAITVLLLHDAVELLMVAILDHLNISAPKNREFLSFWGLLKSAGHPEPPDKVAMETLNTVRVGLKHKGVMPNAKEVENCLTRARGFFENVLSSYCGITLADVSFIDLVPDPEVRAMLVEAERKFASGDKNHAISDLRLAFDRLQQSKTRAATALNAPRAPEMPTEMKRAGWDKYLSSLHEFLQNSASITNMLTLGMDPTRYLDFVRFVPSIQHSYGSTYTIVSRFDYSEVSQQRFNELTSFLIDYALQLSETHTGFSEVKLQRTGMRIETVKPSAQTDAKDRETPAKA